LEIDIEHVRAALFEAKLKLKDKHVQTKGRDALRVFPPESKYDRMLQSMQLLKQSLPNVVVRGLKSVNRAVISVTEASKKRSDGAKEYELLVEGSDLRGVMGISGVNGEKTTCNHIMEVEKRLGIEAARRTIVAQISETMGSHGLFVDERHLMLLADVMCYQGEVLGITRFGIAKMKQSVLMLASFEKTVDYLFNAAVHGLKDTICGVSECIIMGVPMPVGTGVFKLVQRMHDNKTRAAKRELLLSGRFTHKLKM
jgi:DNA-directed RNA polymerase III subunit RPC1